jgi:two-component system, sensor histidine kinase PdtaS
VSGEAERPPVLVVEDYEPVAELERRALVRAGMAVRVVGRIGDACKLLQQEPFSAVLLDYQLPDGDPWSVVELANSRRPRVPVIVVTAMGNERVAAEAIHRGVVEYVRKTGTFYDELPEVVARVAKLANAEERLRRSDALFQLIGVHSQDMISTTDSNGVITSISSACRELLGYEPEELVGTKGIDFVHPEDIEGNVAAHNASPPGSNVRATMRCRRKDGTYTWFECNYHVVRDQATGATLEVLAIARDIMERKRAEVTVRALEVRTKAMLEVVSSLLDLQATHVAGESAPDVLAESRGHVQSVALVHEKLCQSTDLLHVDFADYARALVERLCAAHAAAERGISAVVDAEPLRLTFDKALPGGLILNELVTNALKHAFPEGRTGTVRVALRWAGPGLAELQVSDEGVGLPAGLEPRALGHGLVLALARRMGAEVDVRREGGTAFSVRFASGESDGSAGGGR